jgi:hypothetical protein
MGKINVVRVILGGIVAGIAANLLDFWIDGVLLAKMWNGQLAAWGRPPFSGSQIGWFMGFGILVGLVAVWIYAAIRPRFGAGVKTAIYAGIATWILSALIPNFALMWVTRFFSGHLTVYTTIGAFFEIVIGTICGAKVYREA